MAKKPTKKMEEEEEDNELPLDNDLDTANNEDLDDFETAIVEPDDIIILDEFVDDDEDDDDY